MKHLSWLDFAVASRFPHIYAADVTIYPASHRLYIAGSAVHCTRTHLRLLSLLVSSFCVTVPYERLMNVRGRALRAPEHNLLKVQMCHLRKLLEEHDSALQIRNIYGTGYQARPVRRSAARRQTRHFDSD
jgi:DNA-binding response OmpR family regulator